jgi:RNA polymerase sigma factor (sigma-70 family)
MKNRNNEEHKKHSFDSFCKEILKRTTYECYKAIRRLREREVVFSELSSKEADGLFASDEYFKDEYIFAIRGEHVGVTDIDLAEALIKIPADKREIVMMSYFFEMTDKEIAGRLNMARRTIAYHRTSTLRELRNLLESEE